MPAGDLFSSETGRNAKLRDEMRVYTVSEITRLIKTTLETSVGRVAVEGEVSNFRQPASGHCYFTIKDESAQIRAVLFRSALENQKCKPKDGMQVRVYGDIGVYEKSGDYQIIVRRLEETGRGSLQARFEALKEKLLKDGLFDASRKKPIPVLPQHIGIVTSPTGAAIRDILNILARRFPDRHVLVAPVRVQGEGAAEEIAAAIDLLNQRGGLDVLIIGRGGGSLEDLWAFNEEIVARAIARSAIPTISGVGHETDYTICDFVADLRAPTPSAAAELVIGRKEDFENALEETQKALVRQLGAMVLAMRNRLRASAGHYVFREPRNLLRTYREHLSTFRMRMNHEAQGRCHEVLQRLDDWSMRMAHRVRLETGERAQDVRRLTDQLKALNPLAVLGRGYSVTRDDKGRVIRSIVGIKAGQRIKTLLGTGSIDSDVVKTEQT